ncbi:hypothetical protein ACYFX5_01715 [Bremerella sp. T1]|uniref:hypothetical protein n=1 Tax=Bremerella sp. TYQ1 TaxID=3119568 RepID=UPI001CCE6F94|nr:hypothetical protein [Bremerella volcania]UBM36999.1 hypothetical protein LA756_03665 [Bremerella volcania]
MIGFCDDQLGVLLLFLFDRPQYDQHIRFEHRADRTSVLARLSTEDRLQPLLVK